MSSSLGYKTCGVEPILTRFVKTRRFDLHWLEICHRANHYGWVGFPLLQVISKMFTPIRELDPQLPHINKKPSLVRMLKSSAANYRWHPLYIAPASASQAYAKADAKAAARARLGGTN